jgi:hypothetical protein
VGVRGDSLIEGAKAAGEHIIIFFVLALTPRSRRYELRALLKGHPVMVKVYQRLQMDCKHAQYDFIKQAQKAMDKGKDLIILDDKNTMKK